MHILLYLYNNDDSQLKTEIRVKNNAWSVNCSTVIKIHPGGRVCKGWCMIFKTFIGVQRLRSYANRGGDTEKELWGQEKLYTV